MFSVYCPRHDSKVLLTPRHIDRVVNTPTGVELHWHCPCGATGTLLSGLARNPQLTGTAA